MSPSSDRPGPHGGRQAAALAPHVGKWVALASDDPTEVLVAAETPQEVVQWLSLHRERTSYGMFRVPENPDVNGGFAPDAPSARVETEIA